MPLFQVLSLLLLCSAPAWAVQRAQPRGQVDERARALLQRALQLLQPGGASPQRLIIEAAGQEDLTAEVQGTAPGKETRRAHRETLVIDAVAGAVAWERHTPRTDYSLRWRRFILTPDRRGVVDLANGFGSMRPAPVSEAERAGYRRRVPVFLLQEVLANPGGLRWLGPASGRSGALRRISATLSGIDFTLFFDRVPQLVRVEYPIEFPGVGDTRAAIEFVKWRPHPVLGRFPGGHRVLIGSRIYQEVTYTRVLVDDRHTAEWLRIPPELDAARPAPQRPAAAQSPSPEPGRVTRVGDGGYLVQDLGGFDLMFVDLGGEVLAFDAPAAHPFLDAIPATNYAATVPPVSRDYLEVIRRTLPDKPVRYVMVSHHHSDHLGGVREFLAAGATVIAAATDTAMLRRLSQAAHTLKSGLPAAAAPRIEAVKGRRVIAGSARSVVVYQVGPNPHTDDGLLLWIPDSGILFQGDLFYHRQGEAPPPGRETMNRFFAEWIARQGLRPSRVYGVHNSGFASLEDVERR